MKGKIEEHSDTHVVYSRIKIVKPKRIRRIKGGRIKGENMKKIR